MKSRIGIPLMLLLLIFSEFSGMLFCKASQPGEIKPESLEFVLDKSHSLQNPWTLCTTDDGLVIIPDKGTGNIKVFKEDGKYLRLVKTIGQKEFGSNGLVEPTYCFYDKNKSLLGVLDFGRRSIVLYSYQKKEKQVFFSRMMEVSCSALGVDVQLWGNKLIVSGDYSSKENIYRGYPDYSLLIIDLTGAEPGEIVSLNRRNTHFLLPTSRKYGLNQPSSKPFEKRLNTAQGIGAKGWFEIIGNEAYYAWEGSPEIIKISLKTGKNIPFCKEPEKEGIPGLTYFKRPNKSELAELNRAFNSGDGRKVMEARKRFSYVKNLFVTPEYLLLLYTSYSAEENKPMLRLAICTLKGTIVKDALLKGNPTWRLGFDKGTGVLYSITGETGKFSMLKYKPLPRTLKKSKKPPKCKTI